MNELVQAGSVVVARPRADGVQDQLGQWRVNVEEEAPRAVPIHKPPKVVLVKHHRGRRPQAPEAGRQRNHKQKDRNGVVSPGRGRAWQVCRRQPWVIHALWQQVHRGRRKGAVALLIFPHSRDRQGGTGTFAYHYG